MMNTVMKSMRNMKSRKRMRERKTTKRDLETLKTKTRSTMREQRKAVMKKGTRQKARKEERKVAMTKRLIARKIYVPSEKRFETNLRMKLGEGTTSPLLATKV